MMVEPSDCPEGVSPEQTAEAMYAGMLVGQSAPSGLEELASRYMADVLALPMVREKIKEKLIEPRVSGG